ncbi:hypothetical protein [Neptuniibacter pectenicola]|uniref:hypothetical protein n=1 Tax=Neptuniibacter pectenicola TaxID=1806669 RepID=UPI0008325E81|nr:hypothetical protein [Neptuniibacter pectenicola]
MASISSLVVTLSANSAKLVSELGKSKKNIAVWARNVRKQANVAATALVGTAAATGASIVSIVNGHAAEIDRLAKTAAKFGMDTEALQKIRYQGELTGVSINTVDMALQRMTRRVAEAANGTGEAKDALKELKLEAVALSRMSPDQQFYAIAEAMKSVENQGDKVRLAMKLFDSEGVSLVNTMASDLNATAAEFDSLGIAITSQQAAMVEAFNDSKIKLGSIWDGFKNQITVQLSPAFQLLTDYISQAVIDFGGMGNVATSVVNGIATAAGFVADVFYGWQLVIKNVQILFGKLASSALSALGAVYDKYASLREFMDEDFKRSNFFDGMADAFEFQTNKIDAELDALLKKGRPSLEIDARIKSIQDKVNAAGQATSTTVTDKNTDTTAANTTATKNLAEQIKKSPLGNSNSSVWADIFGSGKADDKKNLIVSDTFKSNARALNAAINRSDANDIQYWVERTQKTVDALAGRGQNGISFGSERTHDIDGMQAVLDRLVDKAQEQPETIGSIDLNVSADGKTLSGKLMGDPDFLKQIKQLVDNTTKETARAVAR